MGVAKRKTNSWKFNFHLNEIRELSVGTDVSFRHKVRSGNSMADVLAKQRLDKIGDFST